MLTHTGCLKTALVLKQASKQEQLKCPK